MEKADKIYVAGHTGLVGSAMLRALRKQGYHNIITASRTQCDLTIQSEVSDFFSTYKPDYVFLAAAKVGGIWANNRYPAEFIYENLAIQNNMLYQAKMHGVKRLVFLGSSCIYPRECLQPIKESYLLTGKLEPTNRPYALAKIAGIEMCWAFNRQFKTDFLAVMPTNLYGPRDNYDPHTAHVIPALIHKMHEAKEQQQETVVVWGTGLVQREFLYSDDLAEACLYLINLDEIQWRALLDSDDNPPIINIGCGRDITIRALAALIQRVVGYTGQLVFDKSKPDGTPRKLLCIEKIKELGWYAKRDLAAGLSEAYAHYQHEKRGLGEVLNE